MSSIVVVFPVRDWQAEIGGRKKLPCSSSRIVTMLSILDLLSARTTRNPGPRPYSRASTMRTLPSSIGCRNHDEDLQTLNPYLMVLNIRASRSIPQQIGNIAKIIFSTKNHYFLVLSLWVWPLTSRSNVSSHPAKPRPHQRRVAARGMTCPDLVRSGNLLKRVATVYICLDVPEAYSRCTMQTAYHRI